MNYRQIECVNCLKKTRTKKKEEIIHVQPNGNDSIKNDLWTDNTHSQIIRHLASVYPFLCVRSAKRSCGVLARWRTWYGEILACVCELAFICAKRVRAIWGVAVKALTLTHPQDTHPHTPAHTLTILTHELAAEWAYFWHDLTLN